MDFNVNNYNYNDRIRNLDVEASGKVNSKKYFPVFLVDGKEYIFKPISKSKPFATPLFSYSEVFWSNIMNKYFDESAPIYKLAKCNGYEAVENKYHDEGTIVPSIINKNEHLVNLLEYFKENPDPNVNINDYINYCGYFYDYTDIFNSNVIKSNEDLGNQLSMQVLFSILRGDINYHYENVAFIYEGDYLKRLAPAIDHEFSTMFLYPDLENINFLNYKIYLKLLENNVVDEDTEDCWPLTINKHNILKNIDYICNNYPDTVKKFIEGLNNFLSDISKFNIPRNDNFQYNFSSLDFLEYKKEEIEGTTFAIFYNDKKIKINMDNYSNVILSEVKNVAYALENHLLIKLNDNYSKTLRK